MWRHEGNRGITQPYTVCLCQMSFKQRKNTSCWPDKKPNGKFVCAEWLQSTIQPRPSHTLYSIQQPHEWKTKVCISLCVCIWLGDNRDMLASYSFRVQYVKVKNIHNSSGKTHLLLSSTKFPQWSRSNTSCTNNLFTNPVCFVCGCAWLKFSLHTN